MSVGGGIDATVDEAPPEEGIVLAVGGDDFAQGLGPEHGLAHHLVALNTPAVVGEGDCLGGHALKVGDCLTFLAQGNGSVGVDVDAGGVLDDGKLLL